MVKKYRLGGFVWFEKEVTLDELENFMIFKLYYERMSCLDLNSKMLKMLNYLINYHFDKVYGEEYFTDEDVVSYGFKVTYEIKG